MQSANAATRSGDAGSVEVEAEFLLSCVADLNEKYDILETVQKAGYYTDVSQFTGDTTDPGFLSALNGNGSDEFVRIATEWFTQDKMIFSLDEIISNNRLLPNEQIALTVAAACFYGEPLTRDDWKQVGEVMKCQEATAKRMFVALVVSAVGGPIGFGAALSFMINAFDRELDCIEKAISKE